MSVVDASDEKQVKDAKTKAGRRAATDKIVVKTLMEHQDGRAWLRRQLEVCHIFQSSFAPGQSDITAFTEGERNIGLRLLAQIQAFPDQYVLMIKEGREPDAAGE